LDLLKKPIGWKSSSSPNFNVLGSHPFHPNQVQTGDNFANTESNCRGHRMAVGSPSITISTCCDLPAAEISKITIRKGFQIRAPIHAFAPAVTSRKISLEEWRSAIGLPFCNHRMLKALDVNDDPNCTLITSVAKPQKASTGNQIISRGETEGIEA